ncbi:unnamed protein product [Owenia fusiformis]|nr:unnamed protein product [Owenia fusiformis]
MMQSEAVRYKQGAPEPSLRGQCWLYYRIFWAFICCCLPGQTKFVKIGVFWGWTVIATISTVLLVRLAIFGTDYPTSSPGDMRLVHKVTNVMCKGITITNEHEDNVFVYSMLGEPPIKPNKKFQSFERNSMVDTYDVPVYWNFYLLTGSEMRITTTVDTAVEFMILQGKEKLDKFLGKKKEKCNNNCHLQDHLYTTGNHFTDMTTSTNDDYYFLYRRTDRSESAKSDAEFSNIDVRFDVNRTVYDLSNATIVCTLSTTQGQTSSCYTAL